MIIGTGVDIVEIDRIEKINFKKSFLNKLFTLEEQEYLRKKPVESTAGYFCAKEAVAKALGTGFSGFGFKDIEIYKANGVPRVMLHNKAKNIALKAGIDEINLSISHCHKYANAVAIAQTTGRVSLNTDRKFPLSIIKPREADSHKGDYGRTVIIGGSYEMAGAMALSAKAALRAGAGLVTCVLPPSILDRVGSNVIEATYIVGDEKDGFLSLTPGVMDKAIKRSNAIAVGIGMGQSAKGSDIVEYLIVNSDKPLLIDADGINLLSQNVSVLKAAKSEIVITPHVGEMSKLISRSSEDINRNRIMFAKEFAQEYHCVVLLKGHRTVVTDGNQVYINETGNPGMATGGSGDVLTGIVSAFLAQGYGGYEAAALGAYVHGYGGDIAFRKYGNGLIASDILDNMGYCLKL